VAKFSPREEIISEESYTDEAADRKNASIEFGGAELDSKTPM